MKNILIITLVIALIAISYLYIRQSGVRLRLETNVKSSITSTQLPIATLIPTNTRAPETKNVVEAAQTSPTQEPVAAPPVVYEPSGLFDAQLKKDLYTMLAAPAILFYTDDKLQRIASLKFSVNTDQKSKTEFPYGFEIILKNGGQLSQVVYMASGKPKYWVPGCYGKCEFSDEFKSKYPQIVSQANGE